MSPRYDFKCTNGHLREDVWVSSFRDAQKPPPLAPTPCEVCGLGMVKQPCAPAFSVKGFNAANRYSKSS